LKQQVFRVFCDDITETGLLDMLRVVKIDLKGRRQTDSDDEDDGRVDIEDDDDTVMEDEGVGEIDDVTDGEDDSSDEGDVDQDDFNKAVPNETKGGARQFSRLGPLGKHVYYRTWVKIPLIHDLILIDNKISS